MSARTYSPIAVLLPGAQDNHRVYGSLFSVCQLLEADIAGVAAFGGDVVGLFLDFYFSARAFGLEVPMGEFFAFMPAVDIISALPISLGGFGIREQLFATLLGELWAHRAQAVSISLVVASNRLTLGIAWLGFVACTTMRWRRRSGREFCNARSRRALSAMAEPLLLRIGKISGSTPLIRLSPPRCELHSALCSTSAAA